MRIGNQRNRSKTRVSHASLFLFFPTTFKLRLTASITSTTAASTTYTHIQQLPAPREGLGLEHQYNRLRVTYIQPCNLLEYHTRCSLLSKSTFFHPESTYPANPSRCFTNLTYGTVTATVQTFPPGWPPLLSSPFLWNPRPNHSDKPLAPLPRTQTTSRERSTHRRPAPSVVETPSHKLSPSTPQLAYGL